jgi:hypothetical protein
VAFQKVNDATFQFTDHSTRKPVFIDKDQGIVVWAGKSRPFVGSVALIVDNGDFGCGPGDITSADQLAGKTEREVLDARQFVWTCFDNAS